MLRRASHWASSSDRRLTVSIVILFIGIFGLTSGGHTYSSDEEGYLRQAIALSQGASAIDMPPDAMEVTAIRGGRGDSLVAGGGIGIPLAAVPFAWVGSAVSAAAPAVPEETMQRFAIGFTNAAIGALLIGVIFLLGRELGAPRPAAVLLSAAAGVGTMIWPYARTALFSELLTALLLASSILLAYRCTRQGTPWGTLASGALAAGAVMARPSALPLLMPIIIYVAWVSWRRIGALHAARMAIAFVFGAGAVLGMLAMLNRWRYGAATDSGYGPVPFDHDIVDGLQGLLLTPGKSLFLYPPLALLGVTACVVGMRRRPPEILLLASVVVINTLIFARFVNWHGDQSWGPRYLLITLPLLVAAIAPLLTRAPWRSAVLIAGCIGIAPAFLGSAIYFNQYYLLAAAEHGDPYIGITHRDPGASPLVGHAGLLPPAIDNTARAMSDRASHATYSGPFPEGTSAQYGWYFQPPMLDTWWTWSRLRSDPGWLLLLLIPLALATAAGTLVVREAVTHE